jgi:hypothetical protein
MLVVLAVLPIVIVLALVLPTATVPLPAVPASSSKLLAAAVACRVRLPVLVENCEAALPVKLTAPPDWVKPPTIVVPVAVTPKYLVPPPWIGIRID